MQPRAATGLAVFRILYSLTLMCEVFQLIYLRRLLFDPIPYIVPGQMHLAPFFAMWLVAIGCLTLGLFTRQAAVANYVATLLTFSVSGYWEYHVDYVYTGIGLFLLFVPVEQSLSIDAWSARRRAAKEGLPAPPTTVPRAHYDALILVGIALVYFDSVFYKLDSPMWMAGLGMWRPASLPHNTYWSMSWLLDLKLIMVTLGYLTLLFEVVFIVAMWFDKLRPLLLIIGMGLHLGIVITFPIPWFGLAVAALYVLLVPDSWWAWLGSRIPARDTGQALQADDTSQSNAALVLSRRRAIQRNAVIVGALALIVTVAQFVQTTRSDLAKTLSRGNALASVLRPFQTLAHQSHYASRTLLGVTPHPVFMDFHFDGYEAFFTLVHVDSVGRQTWLPISNEQGQGSLLWSGRLWVNWNWRVSNPKPNAKMMSSGLRNISAWWLGKNDLGFQDQRFLVMRRECDPLSKWQEGYYDEQLTHKWRPVGMLHWKNGKCDVSFEPDAFEPRHESDILSLESDNIQ
ncbi:MAG: HTTM domain-containing protein [Planctomycetaceae bacterium]|nr:HTTM domain-containing protein [Planctomycetaceae bacterium]